MADPPQPFLIRHPDRCTRDRIQEYIDVVAKVLGTAASPSASDAIYTNPLNSASLELEAMLLCVRL